MSEFRSWPSIEGLHIVLAQSVEYARKRGYPCTFTYRGKTKLHGRCAGVRFREGVASGFQSRNIDISAQDPNYGFKGWSESVPWPVLNCAPGQTITIHGEWAGPGVQKSVAVCKIPRKMFFIFAVDISTDETGDDGQFVDRKIIADPSEIEALLNGWSHPDVRILPWATAPVTINLFDREQVKKMAEDAETLVDQTEKEDPYIKETFGVSGTGEGLVYYPLEIKDLNLWHRYAWKAKGEAHRVKASKVAVELSADTLNSIEEFVAAFVTIPRLEQGLGVVFSDGKEDIRRTGEFVGWVAQDVLKESEVERTENGLDWKTLGGPVQKKARDWFIARCKSL
jgi:hypothetical protein